MNFFAKKSLDSLYIHIPFCMEKCYYCAFVSFVDKNNFKDDYICALSNELSGSLTNHPDIKLKSIYIEGGTPTMLDVEYDKKYSP